jgi:hypothetical protein
VFERAETSLSSLSFQSRRAFIWLRDLRQIDVALFARHTSNRCWASISVWLSHIASVPMIEVDVRVVSFTRSRAGYPLSRQKRLFLFHSEATDRRHA